MGSLMSGWSSTVLGDDKKVRLMRNRSLTNEEVDAFWRQHGRPDNHNTGQSSPLVGSPRVGVGSSSPLLPLSPRRSDESLHQQQQAESPFEARRLDAVRSLPPPSPLARARGAGPSSPTSSTRSEPSSPAAARADDGFPESAADDSPSSSLDWWTRSSWAFLNEPPHKQEEAGVVSVTGRGSRAHKAAVACDQFHVARIVSGNA